MTRASLLLVAAALAVAPAARADKWESPAFASGSFRPSRIVVLPARSGMTRTRVADAVPFVKETKLLEQALRREAGAALTAAGYQPDLDALSPEAIAADRELQSMVRELEERVGTVIDVAAGRPRDIARGRFSVGDAVLPLASRTGAEGFLWLQSESVVPSKGQRALASVFSVLSGGYGVPQNQTQLLAVLLDARTGDLASITIALAGGPVLKEPEKVAANVVGQVFRQWPAHGSARRVPEKRLAAAQAARKPAVPLAGQPVDEQAVIARFEEVDARLSGRPVPEDVGARDEFTQGGEPVAAEGAPPAEPVSLFEPPAEPRGAERPAASLETSAAPADPSRPSPETLWATAGVAPAMQVVLQMLEGEPGVLVKNMTREPVLVSVDLRDWRDLARGEEALLASGPGSHRILVASRDGVELARSTVLVSSRLAGVEIWEGRGP